MQSVDWVIIAVILTVTGAAGWYIYRAKKKGAKCIGCPNSGACAGKGTCGSCGCGGSKEKGIQ